MTTNPGVGGGGRLTAVKDSMIFLKAALKRNGFDCLENYCIQFLHFTDWPSLISRKLKTYLIVMKHTHVMAKHEAQT